MQELVRMIVDQYMDADDPVPPEEIPTVFTVAKGKQHSIVGCEGNNIGIGTEVPDALVLLREERSQFSLQPREPLTASGKTIVIYVFPRANSIQR